MNKHDQDLQKVRIMTLRRKTDFVYREKIKKEPGKTKAVWRFSEREINGRTLTKPNINMFTRKMNTWKEMKKKALKHMSKTSRKQLRKKKTGLTEVYDYNKNEYRALSTARSRKTDFITTRNNQTNLNREALRKSTMESGKINLKN